MISKNKSQSATEFIILLAIILIIAGLLIKPFGTLTHISNNKEQKASKEIWDNKDISLKGIRINSTSFNLTIKNNYPYKINITKIELDNNTINDNYTLDINKKIITTINESENKIKKVKITYINLKNNKEYNLIGPKLFIQ